jgi:hypothetical protein
LLTSLLGSRWIYQPLVDRLATEEFQLEIGSVQLGWFRPIRFADIQLSQSRIISQDEKTRPPRRFEPRQSLVSVQSIESNRGLLGYLFGGRNLGKVTIVQPRLDIELLENGSNLDRLVRAIEGNSQPREAAPKKSPPKFDLDLAIRGLSVSVVNPDQVEPLMVVPPLDVDLSYRASAGASRVIANPTTLLDQVKITPELVRLGLGRAIPLLAESTWFDGRVSLTTERIEVPLDTPEKSTGKAVLTLHEVRSGPSNPMIINMLDMIAKLRNKESAHELVFVDGSRIEVEMANERVSHAGVKAGLPRVDPRLQVSTEGSVGILDRSLELQLSIPVPLEQLARRDAVQELGVPLITLPIRGTLDQPVVDWNSMRHDSSDLLTLVSAALRDDAPGTSAAIGALSGVAKGDADEAIGAAVDLIREIRERRQQRKKSELDEKPPGDEAGSNEGPPRRPLRDSLRNILRGK